MATAASPTALTAEQLKPRISPGDFEVGTAEDAPEKTGWLGQDRAVTAIRMGAEMRHGDYNIFVLGPPGSGRRELVKTMLRNDTGDAEALRDWVYVNNFDEPHKPTAISLAAGGAVGLRSAMERLVDELANDIPARFESDDYQSRRKALEQAASDAHEQAMSRVFEQARARNVAILRTPMGFTFAGTRSGEVISAEQYRVLSDQERDGIDAAIDATQADLSAALEQVRAADRQQRQQVEDLNRSMATEGVDAAIAPLKEAYRDDAEVMAYVEAVRADMIGNTELFLAEPEPSGTGAATRHHAKPQFFRYAVNIMVSHEAGDSLPPPIVEEDLPTLANMIGRVEYASQMGALVTNFTMIRPGALHRANGGFLILDARQVLSEPMAWDALKRCLGTGRVTIYSPEERLGLMSTISLQPDPVPLRLRVILLGERLHYHLLSALDPDFRRLFKVEADLNDHIPAAGDVFPDYARLIARIAQKDGTRPLDPAAVARVFGESARLTQDRERLTLNVDALSDILREADYWAGAAGRATIGAEDLDRTIDERDIRAGRIRDLGQEAITRGTVLVDTDGWRIGQINALSVVQIGSYRFGRPSRLTARTRPGRGKLVDIERETELGGPLHSKGMLILQGYLAATYATDAPMSVWASLVFEQSYGGVDGDSASAAELVALLSSLARIPIDQSLAITGSVNQFGEIQAIGGVNEKIEGFFDICAERGLTGRQGVLIPKANVQNLSLRKRVVEAVADGKFRIVPLTTIDEAIATLTGVDAGERAADETFPDGSFNQAVEARLRAFAEIQKTFAAEGNRTGAGDRND